MPALLDTLRNYLRPARTVPTRRVQESAMAHGAWIDPRERFGDVESFGTGGLATGRMEDREDGQNRPTFQSESDLDEIRAAARVICDTSATAISVSQVLTNYVVGTGYTYTAQPAKGQLPTKDLVAAVQGVIDEFLDDNDWLGDLDRERFWRSCRDGETFLRITPADGGRATVRIVEPEQIQDPQGPDDYTRVTSFGIETDAADVLSVLGYYVRWQLREELEFIDADQILHVKRNVDRNIKRGLSDFFAVNPDLQGCRKLLRNTVKGAALQSSVPYVRQHATGVTATQVQSMQATNATMSYSETDQRGTTRTRYAQEYKPGTVLDVPKSLEYKPSPMANGEAATAYVEVLQAGLRSIGARWSMPEYMISGDASNANYASTLVAESPFVRQVQAEQFRCAQHDRRMLWKVVKLAHDAGRFERFGMGYESIERAIEISVEPPACTPRNEKEATDRHSVLADKGILSPRTWAAKEGLDYDEERIKGAKVAAPPLPGGIEIPAPGIIATQEQVDAALREVGYP